MRLLRAPSVPPTTPRATQTGQQHTTTLATWGTHTIRVAGWGLYETVVQVRLASGRMTLVGTPNARVTALIQAAVVQATSSILGGDNNIPHTLRSQVCCVVIDQPSACS